MTDGARAVVVMSELEAAESLKLSPRTLQRWRVVGGGPGYRKLGKRVVYTPDDILEYLERSRRGNTSALEPEQGG
jgi:DNA-binding transcriptional MerR regulator